MRIASVGLTGKTCEKFTVNNCLALSGFLLKIFSSFATGDAVADPAMGGPGV